jgi:hypothetical protein
MTGILDKFYVQHGAHGARVMARGTQLSGDIVRDEDVDETIQMLKDDLDGCAREMKRRLAADRRGALFEGWPSAKERLDA